LAAIQTISALHLAANMLDHLSELLGRAYVEVFSIFVAPSRMPWRCIPHLTCPNSFFATIGVL
jgi:hypothetical protein